MRTVTKELMTFIDTCVTLFCPPLQYRFIVLYTAKQLLHSNKGIKTYIATHVTLLCPTSQYRSIVIHA